MTARAESRARLLAAAAAFLRDVGATEHAPYLLKLECESVVVKLSCGPQWPDDPAQAERRPGRWVSPLEQRIVDFLTGRPDVWTKGEEIAAALCEEYQHKFKAILSNLGERDVIVVQQGRGYKPLPNGPLRRPLPESQE